MSDGPDQDQSWGENDAVAPTGGDFLNTLDPSRASQVKALAEGRMNLPSGYSLRSPIGQQLLADVAQYDPSFDVANAPARMAARKAFTSGKQGQNITSFNTAIGHLGTLAQRSEDLSNSSVPLWNSLANTAETATGDPRVTNFNVAKQAVVDELERAFKGTGGNVHEIEQWENTLNSSRSPAQLRGAIGQAADLLNSRIGAMRDSYNNAMGTTDQPLPMLNQHASDALAQFQSPDYLSKGYGSIAAHPGLPSGPTDGSGGGQPPSAGGGDGSAAPPAGPAPAAPAAPAADKPVLSADGSSDMVSSRGKEFTAEANALLQTGKSTPADYQALAQKYGYQSLPFDAGQLQNAIAYTNKGGKGAQIAPPVEHTDANPISAIANSAVGSAGIGLADTGSFGLLPKAVAGINAVKDRLTGDNRGIGDIYGNELADAHARMDASEAAHPLAALGGQVGGFITGGAALGNAIRAIPGAAGVVSRVPGAVAPLANDALQGGLYSAGSQDSLADVPGAALKGAALSAAGGVLGRGLANLAGKAIAPTGGALAELYQAGVRPTIGMRAAALGAGEDTIGGAAKRFVGSAIAKGEEASQSLPIAGLAPKGARDAAREQFETGAFNKALGEIGDQLPDGVKSGNQAHDYMQKSFDNAYDDARSGMVATRDGQFQQDAADLANQVANGGLTDGSAKRYNQFIGDMVDRRMTDGVLAGDDFKKAMSDLGAKSRQIRSNPTGDHELADALDNYAGVLDASARRSSDPASVAKLDAADRGYAMAVRIEDAAGRRGGGGSGRFTPTQLDAAVQKQSGGVRSREYLRGGALLQSYSDAGKYLADTLPNSGTAERLMTGQALTGAALGSGAVAHVVAPQTVALSGLAALPYVPGVRNAVGAALAPRSASGVGGKLNTLGAWLRANAEIGGAIGAPALLAHRGN